ncbi:response regulator [Salinisphaera sp. SPP-AMP-43]|uniref:response regulator transcription factor n=1 Tax=Salinisphaera sp. SPP-AMP-43 TaxID=3121288 RepID=UPI003C6E8DB3
MSEAPLIAVVDDDVAVANSIIALLKSDGFHARMFTSAEAFLGDTGNSDYCCLIVDWLLPGMSGAALCRRMIGKAPIIFMTGAYLESRRVSAVAGGEVEFLSKPFDPEQLLATIARVCGELEVVPDLALGAGEF